jgi:hypothetical protein
MKRLLLAAALLVLGLGATSEARSPDTYQVTGQVVAVDADVITVLKGGKEKFEIARDPADKTEIKVGDKVTIKYRMSAASIEKKK